MPRGLYILILALLCWLVVIGLFMAISAFASCAVDLLSPNNWVCD